MYDLVLLSGGIDSSTVLAELVSKKLSPRALTFDYGQRHAKQEIGCANQQAARYGVPWKVLRLDLDLASALTDNTAHLPATMATERDATYVPARNTWMVALAAAQIRRGTIWLGCNEDDGVAYPDCTQEWVDSMNQTLRTGGVAVTVNTPYITLPKKCVVSLAWCYGVDLHKTWSCYRGADEPCGRCGACDARRKAGA